MFIVFERSWLDCHLRSGGKILGVFLDFLGTLQEGLNGVNRQMAKKSTVKNGILLP